MAPAARPTKKAGARSNAPTWLYWARIGSEMASTMMAIFDHLYAR